jgi:hypothetical protein
LKYINVNINVLSIVKQGSNGESGFKTVASNLNSLLEEAMNELKDKNWKLESVACCLSGGGTKLAQSLLLDEFKKLNVDYSVHVANDSLAAIFTAFKNGKNFHCFHSL